jgi:hypothetical protein
MEEILENDDSKKIEIESKAMILFAQDFFVDIEEESCIRQKWFRNTIINTSKHHIFANKQNVIYKNRRNPVAYI